MKNSIIINILVLIFFLVSNSYSYYNISKYQLQLSEKLIDKYQLNSADLVLEGLKNNTRTTRELLIKENNIKRNFDSEVIFYIITGVIVIIFIGISIKRY